MTKCAICGREYNTEKDGYCIHEQGASAVIVNRVITYPELQAERDHLRVTIANIRDKIVWTSPEPYKGWRAAMIVMIDDALNDRSFYLEE